MTPGRIPLPPLVLAPALRAQVERRAQQEYPREACGLLIGRRAERAVVVEHVARAENLLESGLRYELAPADWLASWRAAERRQAQIVGVWHSHPDHGAMPSRADRAAAWADYCYLIAAVSPTGVSELRCWRLESSAFLEQPVVGALQS